MADIRLVEVEGLRDFLKRLKQVDSNLPKAVRLAMNDAVQIVIDEAKPRIPRRTGRAAASVRAASTRTSSRIRAGGARAPYFPWLDWGGRVGRKRSVRRTYIPVTGRYLYRAYFKKRDDGSFEAALEDALQKVARDAGIDLR